MLRKAGISTVLAQVSHLSLPCSVRSVLSSSLRQDDRTRFCGQRPAHDDDFKETNITQRSSNAIDYSARSMPSLLRRRANGETRR